MIFIANIKLLDESTINKIAAGEVIERPSSVIKELIENSIDANSKSITIIIKDGGKREISVIDDGDGMDYDDLKLSIKKHATSKISRVEDIYSLHSYGFRGEALGTISEISRFEIISSTKDMKTSYRMVVNNGKLDSINEYDKIQGTKVSVHNIFYNIPARQKFLKSDAYELKKCLDIIKNIALANPSIAFKIHSNESELLNLRSASSYSERVKDLYDLELDFTQDSSGDVIILHSKPERVIDISDPKQQFFVNGRYIKSDLISKAIYKAYESRVPKGKKANVFLFLKVNPNVVDVNVHPQKLEVRFSDESLIYGQVYNTLNRAFESVPIINTEEIISKLSERSELPYNSSVLPQKDTLNITRSSNQRIMNFAQTKLYSEEKPVAKDTFKIIGQIFSTFIIVETVDNRLLIIDQHVAQERFYYEKFKSEFTQNNLIKSQSLISPLEIKISSEYLNLLEERKFELESLGFDISIFGGNSIVVRRIPLVFDKVPSLENMRLMIEDLVTGNGNYEELIDHRIATMACKASIKAGDMLSYDVMRAVISDLLTAKSPFTCPHGRPIVVEMTLKELEKKVGRI